MNINQQYAQASIKTGDNLRTVAHSLQLRELSQLSLPEIDNMVDMVAQVAPAGNVPGLILNGLARLSGRRPPRERVKRDVNLLFKGVEQALDRAVYGAFFAGPAAIIWGYQNLLKLAGKDPESAFPEGTWQFYVDYALREDTARHANETHGFDTMLKRHQVQLNLVDRTTAWVMASIHCLHQYPDLLANEWRERTYTYLLQSLTADEPDARHYAQLYRQWQAILPYSRGTDAAPTQNYATYRRRKFDQFLAQQMKSLRPDLRRQWVQQVQQANTDLMAYQKQLTILAYLQPDAHGETRTPLPLAQVQVGVIYQDRYYVLPICQAGGAEPADVAAVRAQIAAFMSQPVGKSAVDLTVLAKVQRAALADLQGRFNQTLRAGLDQLRRTPILINVDKRPSQLPLADIRQAERGIGSHALTLFDTKQTVVFDQSHIFFDGAWSAAFSEIMTNEALAWAFYLRSLPPPQPDPVVVKPLAFPFEPGEIRLIEESPQVTPEVSVETAMVKLEPILKLRRLFKQRSDLLKLTVNDLLVLYRAIHCVTYQLNDSLLRQLQAVRQEPRVETAVGAILDKLQQTAPVSPAMLIPVDATYRHPYERIYPLVLEVPLSDLDLIELHQRTIQALDAYEAGTGDRQAAYEQFDACQRTYLAALAGFGEVMHTAKEIALKGESASVRTIKLLAHMPTPLQRLLDKIPGRFEVLNDLIKGSEVFSNVGAVVRSSTLTRFITAKDDNEKKDMAWGILTDATGTMQITLRDFRPHVGALKRVGHKALATHLAQHYLDSYAHGLNHYVEDWQRITQRSRQTQLYRDG